MKRVYNVRFFLNITAVIQVFVIVLLLSTSVAKACMFPKFASKAIEESNIIFSGKVIERKTKDKKVFIKFSVHRVWKGDVSKEIVFTGLSTIFTPNNGHKYLVYAKLSEDGGYPKIFNTMCDRTSIIDPWWERKWIKFKVFISGGQDIEGVDADFKLLGKPSNEFKNWNKPKNENK